MLKNKYGELRSGWSLLASMLILVAGQLLSGALASNVSENNLLAKLGITLLYGAITIGGILLLYKLIYKRPFAEIGLPKKGWIGGLAHGLLFGGVCITTVFCILLLTRQAYVLSVDTSKLLSATTLVEFISVACFMASEEILTRGYMMTALKTTRNKYIVLFIPLLIFTALHFTTPGFTFISITNTFIVGLLFAYMFIKSGKLWLPIGFHIAWNFIEGDILGMRVSGNMQAAIFSTQMGQNALLTGGSAGPEGGILVTIVLFLAFIYVHFAVKPAQKFSWVLS